MTFLSFFGFARLQKFFDPKLDFRVRLYNILAFCGMIVGVFMTLQAAFILESGMNIVVNGVGALLALGLFLYSYRSGCYRLCYVISIGVIFLGLFPVLFFLNEGYHGGMPIFFVFAILFTIFMLEGLELLVITTIEALVYISLCCVAWLRPELTVPFESEWLRMQDIVFTFVCVSGILGAAMFMHFRLYKDQQLKLEKAGSAKTNFLANVSHEIRTPLNVILGMNEMIRSSVHAGPIAVWSADIQMAGYTLRKLIDELLDISEIEAGRQMISGAEYQISNLLYNLSVIGEQETKKRGLDFTIQADPGMPSKLGGDFSRVLQIVANFLTNAAKYTERGTVTLTAEAVFLRGTGREVSEYRVSGQADSAPLSFNKQDVILRLSVSDTGTGIKQEDIGSLFEKFSRVRGDITKAGRYVEGIGLGLAIAKQLSDLMNGEIKVESVWGEGSTFTLSLPQRLIDTAPIGDWRAGLAEGAEPESFPGSPYEAEFAGAQLLNGRILVVDDNPGNLQVVKEFLRLTGLRTDTASDGCGCVAAVKQAIEEGEPYHVILMDYMMPGMNGIETLEKLWEEIPAFDAPVIALTADAVKGEQEKFLNAGFDAYLSKPITRRDLERAISALLPKDLGVDTPRPEESEQPKTPGEPEEGGANEIKNDLKESDWAKHGISLSEGLKYASGDMALFQTQAQAFLKKYAEDRRVIERKRDEGDWEDIARLVHGLKSWAAYTGAAALRDSALEVEVACRADDVEYASTALPLLFLKWERACKGFGNFIRHRMEKADG